MDKPIKFALPSPNFNKNAKDACKPKPHFLTPSGMSLLPREKQPPPMYGKHGATVPPRYLQQQRLVSDKSTIADTPPPPPEKQYCEPCELELNSLEDLKRHRAQHEKCPVAGCLYKGHPSVMDKHVNALHASGLFDKFKKLSTPEEIAAWRDERRKRYPTLANVLLKKKAQEQRQKRGERLEANKNRFGKPNDRKRAQPNDPENTNPVEEKKPREEGKSNQKNNKRNRNKNKRNQKNNKNNQDDKPKVQNSSKPNNEKKEEENDLVCGGIKMFTGTSQMKDYKHFNDKKKLVTSNALFGLVGMYGSDDEDDDNEESEENESVGGQNDKDKTKIVEAISELTDQNENMETETEKLVNSSFIKEDIEVSSEKLPNEDNSEKIPKEDSSSSQQAYNSNDISEDKTDTPNNRNMPINEKKLTEDVNENATPKDNSSDEAPEETPIQRSIPDYPVKSLSNPNKTSIEETVEKRNNQTEKSPSISKPKQAVKRKSGLDYRKARLRKQNTMLEKLLEADIRHERNVLLQCVRYVCENNFFGIGQKSQEKPD
ncbi:nuclear fragile X mental retardation-interacting protein 1 [Lucilia sericata]|uniref:nuclear fragile X mental retardation-interacting protein 1 n=1 Tax=Lucilia sericata TaxID=13632 RepID=UPI0018A86E3C|nr:nuclear fragile X mental retardation-interacting protein 1 [Lucilia sericata]